MKFYRIETSAPHDFSSGTHIAIVTATAIKAHHGSASVLAWLRYYLTAMML